MTVMLPKWLLFGVLGIAVLGGSAFGAYTLGADSKDEGAAYARGRAAGVTSGKRVTEDKYATGGSGYLRIYNDAYDLGRRKGRQAGLDQGQSQGRQAGASGVFEGYEGGWQTGRFYIVKVDRGSTGEPYSLPSRLLMEPGQNYELCGQDICGRNLGQ